MVNDPNMDRSETTERAARIIAEALAQGLMEAEIIIAAEREARAQQVPAQLLEAIERFGDVLSRVVEFTERLGDRTNELTDAVTKLAEEQERLQQAVAQRPQAPSPELERAFAPGGEGIDVTIAAVPGFQGLMELQKTLVRMAQVESAAVRRYQDDEAAIQLVLKEPMPGSAIAEGVTTGTGRQITVDESRPDTLRLRLRFIEG